jgi:hypothetical protein
VSRAALVYIFFLYYIVDLFCIGNRYVMVIYYGPVRQQTAPIKSVAPLRSDLVALSGSMVATSERRAFGWLRSANAWAASPLKRDVACFEQYHGSPAQVELNVDGL